MDWAKMAVPSLELNSSPAAATMCHYCLKASRQALIVAVAMAISSSQSPQLNKWLSATLFNHMTKQIRHNSMTQKTERKHYLLPHRLNKLF